MTQLRQLMIISFYRTSKQERLAKYLYPPPPPPQHTLKCIRVPNACSHFFLGGRGIWGEYSREHFPRKPGKGGVFVIAKGNQYRR